MSASNLGHRAQRLLYIVRQIPGIHLREVQRLAHLGLGDTVYQLRKLVSLGLIDSAKFGKYRRLYPPDVEAYDRNIFSALLSTSRRRILMNLLASGESNLSALASSVELSKSTVSWHIRILRSQGIVTAERGKYTYKLENPSKVTNIISRFKPSILDRLSEGFLESWELLDQSSED